MPFFDQHWRLRVWGGVLAALAAVLFPVRYFQVAAAWDTRAGWDLTPDVIFAVVLALALALAAVLLARSVAPARQREQVRLDYISGREMPRREKPKRAAHGEPPLVAVQRIGAFDHGFGCFAVLLTVSGLVVIAIAWVWTVEILFGASAALIDFTNSRAFLAVILALVMPFGVWIFGTWARDAVSRSPRYTADAEGLTWRSRWGRSHTVRWDDVRLLELTTYRLHSGYAPLTERRYLLYGHDAVIRIDSAPGFHRDCSRLIEYIHERTGLDIVNLGKPWPPEPVNARVARFLAHRSRRTHNRDGD